MSRPTPRSRAAKKGWKTRRLQAAARTEAARRGWATRRATARSEAARLGWETRRERARAPTKVLVETPHERAQRVGHDQADAALRELRTRRRQAPTAKPLPLSERDEMLVAAWPNASAEQKKTWELRLRGPAIVALWGRLTGAERERLATRLTPRQLAARDAMLAERPETLVRAEELALEAIRYGWATLERDAAKIATWAGIPIQEIYTLALSPPSMGHA